MQNRFVRLAMVAMLAGSLVACNNNRGGGGGGSNNNMGSGRTKTEQAKSNMAPQSNLRSEGKDLADAYAHVAWIHADLAANDWERALDDLQTVQKKLDGIKNDKAMSAALKQKVMAIKPQVAVVNSQIQKHDKGAIKSTVVLLGDFTKVMDDPAMMAWLGNRGGGAGR
jgi:hypothetical protein